MFFCTSLLLFLIRTIPIIINNINNNVEGAIVTLEVLKNEGLISNDLDIDYKDNYYIVTKALLSNVSLNDNVVKEECDNSIGLETISSWAKNNDSNDVLYFCPKEPECETVLTDPAKMCEKGTLEAASLACNIINNAKNVKGNDYTIFGTDSRTHSMETVFRKQTHTINITDSNFNEDIYFLAGGYTNIASENYKNYYSGFTTKERNAILAWVSEKLAAGEEVYFSPRDRCNYYRDTTTYKYLYSCNGGANETVSKIVSVSDDCTRNGCEIKYKLIDTYNSTVRSLEMAEDNFGLSYYFKGNVIDNYVNFAGMCWRIVRIAGDGSTKLILEDQYTTCDDTETETTSAVYTGNWNIGTGNYGYDSSSKSTSGSTLYKMNYLNPVTNNTSSMVKAFYDFQTTKLADYTGKLKSGDWCLGDKAYTRSGSSGSYTYTLLEDTSSNYLSKTSFYYDAYTRLSSGNSNGYQPTLKCNGTILNEFADVSGVSSKAPMYVSTITADEIVYAGGKLVAGNYNYYLMNNYRKDSYSFWSLSPGSFYGSDDYAFRVDYSGDVYDLNVDYNLAFRPAVSLTSSAVITEGVGTLESPYIIG